jgi:hypothetical protein
MKEKMVNLFSSKKTVFWPGLFPERKENRKKMF